MRGRFMNNARGVGVSTDRSVSSIYGGIVMIRCMMMMMMVGVVALLVVFRGFCRERDR